MDELEDVALVFVSQTSLDPESPTRYAVTEVSTTIELHHVTRARLRAAIMNSAPGIEAVAAVIGTAITPEARQVLGSDVTAMGMDLEGEECELAIGEPAAKEHDQPEN